MRSTWKLLVLLLALALAVPATVLAQSAGDEQYVDPFQGQDGGGGGGGGNGGGGDGSQGGGSDGGSTTTAQTTPSDTAGTTAESTASESADGSLPRTGLPLLPIALTGLFLFGAGLSLRRVARLPSAAVPGHLPLPVAPQRPVSDAGSARAPDGLPAVGLGLVGLFVLSGLLRRRA